MEDLSAARIPRNVISKLMMMMMSAVTRVVASYLAPPSLIPMAAAVGQRMIPTAAAVGQRMMAGR